MTSVPRSCGVSQETCRLLQVVATTPRLLGGSGGLAVFTVRWSDLAVRMNVLLTPSSEVEPLAANDTDKGALPITSTLKMTGDNFTPPTTANLS